MLTETKLSSRIAAYAAMATALLNCADGEAAVIYTDLDPDVELQDTSPYWGDPVSHGIDFDGDGSAEFTLRHDFSYAYSTWPYYSFRKVDLQLNSPGAAVMFTTSGGFTGCAALSAGVSIGSSAPFYSGAALKLGQQDLASTFYGYYSTVGVWNDVSDGYLGVRFVLPEGVHYGWIRLDVLELPPWGTVKYDKVIIKEFAYEDQPGVPIAAGDVGCEAPAAPTGTVLPPATVELGWQVSPVADVEKFQVRGGLVGDVLRTRITDTTAVSIAGLTPGATYAWKVRARCLDGSISAFSPEDTFTVPMLSAREEEFSFPIFQGPFEVRLQIKRDGPGYSKQLIID